MTQAKPSEPRNKLHDRSIVLLLTGIVVLMPPMIGIPPTDAKIFGIPASMLYILFVWLILIGGAAFLSRRLQDSTDSSQQAGTADVPD